MSQLFESHAKQILGLERLMLEASGFDFRNRYPQKILMKLVKSCDLDERVGATAYRISLDMYRTFVPLKQTTQTMALAGLELAIRLCDVDLSSVKSEHGFDYDRWATTRPEIMGMLQQASKRRLADLYLYYRNPR
jgi:CTD kinase subunit beta